jgi:putative membrane protein
VPAGWLVFAEGVVYAPYGEQTLRLWGMDATTDQQLAGAVMKVAGGLYLWSIIVYVFFTKFAPAYRKEHDYRRGALMPDAEIVGQDEVPLTTGDMERAFAESPAAPGSN